MIDDEFLGAEGLPYSRGRISGATAYIGVMQGEVLSKIYDEYGQSFSRGM